MGLALYRQHAFDAMWDAHGALMYTNTPQSDIDTAIYRDTHYLLERALHLDYAKLLTAHITPTDAEPIITPDDLPSLLSIVSAFRRPRQPDARERYDWLISFLRGAVDAGDPVVCSW